MILCQNDVWVFFGIQPNDISGITCPISSSSQVILFWITLKHEPNFTYLLVKSRSREMQNSVSSSWTRGNKVPVMRKEHFLIRTQLP